MNKKLVLLGTALLLTAASVSAQKRVTGRVVDSEGQPVVGATVRVEGHKGVVTTDSEGRFVLPNVSSSAKHLRVTYIGKKDQTVSIASNVNVTMADNDTELGEAYVVAYGRATKASFTGAAAQIKGEKVENKNTTNVTQALTGEVAGVQIVSSDGNPGASAAIYIRGIGSINASSQPLLIVDGVPYGGSFSSIDPKDIESLDIMKDATASALYGSRGANGVVIITTKHGKQGKLNIGADVKYSVSGRWIPTYDVIKSPERFTELTWEGMRNNYLYNKNGYDATTAAAAASEQLFSESGIPDLYNMWNAAGSELINAETGLFNSGITRRYNPESWEDALFRTGQKFEGAVNFSGGDDRTTYYTAVGYTKDKGYVIGADFQRFTARTNLDSKITPWLKATVGLSYVNMESNTPVQDAGSQNNALIFSNSMPYLYPVYQHDEDGNLIPDENVGGYKYDYGNTTNSGRPYGMNINPVGSAYLDMNRTKSDLFDGKGSLEAKFLTDFRFTVSLGYTYNHYLNDIIMNPFYGDGESAVGRLEKEEATSRDVTANQILNWAHTFDNVHHLSAFVGHESYWGESQLSYGAKRGFVRAQDPEYGNALNYQSLNGYNYGYSMESWFGQVSYDYAEKYFINASLRADGSSRFAKGNRWGTFGSIGAAWNITKEDFMKNQNIIRNLKLKASWGLLGNQSLSTSVIGMAAYYPYNDIYTIGVMNEKPSFTLSRKGNKDLTWEKTSSFNVGLEFDVAGIVEGEFDYFVKNTRDMLFLKSVAPSLGFSSYPINDGKMRNSGFELSLVAHAIKRQDLSLDVRLNMAHYSTTITEMPMDDATGERQYYYATDYYAWQKGRSRYDFYLREYAGVNPDNGHALFNKYVATFEDGTTADIADMCLFEQEHQGQTYTIASETTEDATEATYKYVGETALPSLQGGFGFDLRYKNVTLGATFSYALGGKAIDYTYQLLMADNDNGTYNWHKDIENRWQKPGDVTDVPALTNGSTAGKYANATSTRWLTSRSYLQLSSLRLAWNVPEAWTRVLGGMHGVQLFATGENLFLISARKGFMPGTSFTGTSTYTQYLPSSSFTFGLKLNF